MDSQVPQPMVASEQATTPDALGSVPESPGGVLLLLLTAAVLVLLSAKVSRALRRLAVRLGWDGDRTLSRLERTVQWGVVLIAVGVVLRRLFAPLPTWSPTVLGLLAIAAWLLSTGTLSDILGGLAAQFRNGLRVGDHVDIGGLSGQVREIHWSHVQLRSAGGKMVSVPGRRFLSETVKVAPLRGSQPITVRVPLRRPMRDAELDGLRMRLLFMPYRIPGSPLRMEPDGSTLTVTCALWQQRALAPAESFVRAACAEVLEQDEKAIAQPKA